MQQSTLNSVVATAKLGDNEAIGYLASYLLYQFNVPDDVFDCFLFGLWQAIQHYDPDRGSFVNYARVIIRNEIRSRRQGSDSRLEPDISGYFNTIPSAHPHPDDIIIEKDMLQRFFQQLTKDESAVIYCRFFLCMSHQEAGENLRITARRSKYLQKCALEKLRNYCKKVGIQHVK